MDIVYLAGEGRARPRQEGFVDVIVGMGDGHTTIY